jgi:hypothetical protein
VNLTLATVKSTYSMREDTCKTRTVCPGDTERSSPESTWQLLVKLHLKLNQTEITNKMQPCIRIYYSNLLNTQRVSSDTPLIIRSSKTVIAASGFTYVCGCRQLSWLSRNCRQPQTYVKPEAAITVFELLMMSGMSLETC